MGDPDGEAVKTAKNVPGSEGLPCRWDATGRNGIASPPEGNAYGSRRYISGEATGTGNPEQATEDRKQVSETGTGTVVGTGTGTETETETETGTETEKRLGIDKRLPRSQSGEKHRQANRQLT